MQAFRTFLGHNDMMAYLAMMAPRLVELRRVLKPTGSLYLHCDPTASHYLKLLLDAVFGQINYRSGDNLETNHDALATQSAGRQITTRYCSTQERRTLLGTRPYAEHGEEYVADNIPL